MLFNPTPQRIRKIRAVIPFNYFALVLACIICLAGCGLPSPARVDSQSLPQVLSQKQIAFAEASSSTPLSKTSSAANLETMRERACLVSSVKAKGEFTYQNSPLSLFQWSPDSSALALQGPTSSPFDGALRLVFAPTFNAPRTLASEARGNIFWSPDQKRIAFLAFRKTDEFFTIKVIEVASGSETDLFPGNAAQTNPGSGPKEVLGWWDNDHLLVTTSCGSGCQHPLKIEIHSLEQNIFEAIDHSVAFSWSPDRNYVAYGLGAMPQFLVAHIQHDQIKKLESIERLNRTKTNTQPSEIYFTFFQGWAADSSGFIFLRVPSSQKEPATLWQWNVKTEIGTPLLDGVVQAAWSPDRARIAFVSLGEPRLGRNGEWQGVEAKPNGPNPIGVGVYRIADGKVVFYKTVGETSEGYNGYLPGQDLYRPAWSPSSDRVGFIDANGMALILRVSDLQLLPLDTNAKKVGSMRWAPNGKNLAVSTPKRLLIFSTACQKP